MKKLNRAVRSVNINNKQTSLEQYGINNCGLISYKLVSHGLLNCEFVKSEYIDCGLINCGIDFVLVGCILFELLQKSLTQDKDCPEIL